MTTARELKEKVVKLKAAAAQLQQAQDEHEQKRWSGYLLGLIDGL